MKILVTGGAGFIGSHVVDSLLEKNHEVVVIDNLSTGKIDNLNQKAKLYKKDILDDLSEIFEKESPEIVIHMAAQVMLRKSLEKPMDDAKTNILGTINILEECRKNKIKKIIYTSTGGARVGEPEYLPVDEKHPINPISPYGISKHTAEHYVWMYNKLYNLDYMIFCFGNVYGPRDDPKFGRVISVFIDKIKRNENPIIFGDGKQVRDFIYVKDLALFIVECLNKSSESKLFHLANGERITINYVFEKLKEISGFKGNVEYIDKIKGEVKEIVLDTSLAVRELNWEVKTKFEDGLRESFESK